MDREKLNKLYALLCECCISEEEYQYLEDRDEFDIIEMYETMASLKDEMEQVGF